MSRDLHIRRAWGLVLLVSAAAVLGLVVSSLVWVNLALSPSVPGTIGGHGATKLGSTGPSGTLSVKGDAAGSLWPGIALPVDVELTNPLDAVVTVRGISIRLDTLSAPSADVTALCSLTDFRVAQMVVTNEIALPAHTTVTLSSLGISRTRWPQVSLLDRATNQDGCKGATLTLAYSATTGPGR